MVEPSPSCPYVLRPQHCMSPIANAAHVCDHPGVIVTNLDVLETALGASRVMVVLSPTWPNPLAPQQYMWPAGSNAQVWRDPVPMAAG